jgi:predicted nucleic acid-binding protein
VQAWLAASAGDELAISAWVVTEFSSALSIKVRARQLRPRDRATALAMFTRLAAESFSMLPIGTQNFHRAASFADRYELGLRAGDALHLAVCADHGATLCTLDRRLAQAGTALGVPARLL